MENKINCFTLTISYKIMICVLGSFIMLLLLLPYAQAAPPLGGMSPTPAPEITSTLINLSSPKKIISPTSSDPITNMPTALPAALATATQAHAIVTSPLDLDITIISSDETSDPITANQQDDEWRASSAAQGMTSCVRGTLSDAEPTVVGINETLFTDNTTTHSISYSLREIDDSAMGTLISGGEHPQGMVQEMLFMKETAPVPQELLDLGQAVGFEEQAGSNTYANGLLFTFSSPGIRAFGAWFGGLGSRAPLEGSGLDGDPRGGKLAYMRLFDAEGGIIGPDRPIRPAQKEDELLCFDANEQPIECGGNNTRWVGFIASQPVSQMLLVVGDNDDSDKWSTCRVEADGGTEADFLAQCQAGDEHLSFIGPTICTENILEAVALDPNLGNSDVDPINTSNTSNTSNTNNNNNSHSNNHSNNNDSQDNNTPTLLQFAREHPMESLALSATGVGLLALLASWVRKRG